MKPISINQSKTTDGAGADVDSATVIQMARLAEYIGYTGEDP